MAGAKRGRPPKRKRNITGLRNQGNPKVQGTYQELENPPDPGALSSEFDHKLGRSSEATDEGRNVIEEDRVVCEEIEEHVEGHLGGEESLEDSVEAEEPQQAHSSQYAAVIDENIDDEDWVPEEQKRRKKRRQEREREVRSSTYATGPVISKASERTKRRRRKEMINQKSLLTFGFEGNAPVSNGFHPLLSSANICSSPSS